MLISAILPTMTLYQLPHGQYGYRGHVINLLQDIASIPADLDVGKGGAVGHHRDFRESRLKKERENK